jgi:hypothetical protein
VSPAYVKEFITPAVSIAFEKSLASSASLVPQAQWVRLDRLSELNSNANFWDLVHMNTPAQQMSTKYLLSYLQPVTASR